ncbi:hypothetical protein LZA78_02835 [Sinirhodobacter sp. WL0062]|uniref:Uncharacterized protein n=1 Tax=Rhodobacter flavimaris TaxID=2907145 RepID=A0ABS8YXI6_9RHOB|nr:hypothetical protein [Sinirhodobacter sp. WL0062]MCE5972425.1 hypothetical protein [Sinirhodobacter sp. WL0062]
MDIGAYITDYIDHYREPARQEMKFYAQQSSLSAAISVAASCRCANGKRHPHQRRIPRAVLARVEQRLLSRSEAISEVKDFESLLTLVDDFTVDIRGIGELAVYDIAHRIGAYLRLAPEKVYLHAGTRVGARALGFSGSVVERAKFGPAFADLSAAEIEDFLCIFKGALRGGDPIAGACKGAFSVGGCFDDDQNYGRGCEGA